MIINFTEEELEIFYKPFGKAWRKEMMKLKKSELIDFIFLTLQETQKLKDEAAALNNKISGDDSITMEDVEKGTKEYFEKSGVECECVITSNIEHAEYSERERK